MISRTEIEALLRATLSGVDFDADAPLTQAGLSSLDVIVIVSQLHAQLGVRIPAAEMKAANFESVDSIVRLAQKYQPQPGGDS